MFGAAPKRDDKPHGRQDAVPPLFAELFRDEAPHELHAKRAEALTAALNEVTSGFGDLRFCAAFGAFREAAGLSRGIQSLERRALEAAVLEAEKLSVDYWPVAESLLWEASHLGSRAQFPQTLWAAIERQRLEENVRSVLDGASRAAKNEADWGHALARLKGMLERHPSETRLESCLRLMDELSRQFGPSERAKNLDRLKLFQNRLDLTEQPQTLHGFMPLVKPFVAGYQDEPEFAGIVNELEGRSRRLSDAQRALAENRLDECARLCDEVLAERPRNILFADLKEKVKSRQWVALLADSSMQRAREFEQEGRYSAALDELESLRAIDPQYPGLDSAALHYAALKEHAVERTEAAAEPEPEMDTVAAPVSYGNERPTRPEGMRISITSEAWTHLQTGLAALIALLMLALVLFSALRKVG